MISAIVAVDTDWGIGYNGELLERIPEDMKRFKKLTTDNIVVMGRKTQDSLPNKKLSERINIVITNQAGKEIIGNKELLYMNLDNLFNYLTMYILKYYGYPEEEHREIFIIGGGSIYSQLLPYCDTLYITRIDKHHENVDTYFSNIAADADWKLVSTTKRKEYNGIPYWFETYERQ